MHPGAAVVTDRPRRKGRSDDKAESPAGHSDVLIVAGEISGDMRAAGLVTEIRKRRPDLTFFGIGGPAMRKAGVDTVYDVSDMAVMGFAEVVHKFRFFRRVFHELVAEMERRKPAAAILVDYPGFNLRLAERTRRMELTNIYYICPQVWAWNRGRIPKMARIVDRLIAIFPFEQEVFEGTGLDVDFVGHPLVDEARAVLASIRGDLPWSGRPRIALLPGSRVQEIDQILPRLCRAAMELLKSHADARFLVAAPSERIAAHIENRLKGGDCPLSRYAVVTGRTLQVLRDADAAMVASGTATVEAALMRCPMIVVYHTAPITYLVARCLVRVDHIGMVNIVAGKKICPEFIQGEARARPMADALRPLLSDTPARREMLKELDRVREALGKGGAASRAAEIVLQALSA